MEAIRKYTLNGKLENNEVMQAGPSTPSEKIPIRVPSQLQGLIPEFIENRYEDVENIETAISMQDFETIRILGHRMKGSGGGYGFDYLSTIGGSPPRTSLIERSQEAKVEDPGVVAVRPVKSDPILADQSSIDHMNAGRIGLEDLQRIIVLLRTLGPTRRTRTVPAQHRQRILAARIIIPIDNQPLLFDLDLQIFGR